MDSYCRILLRSFYDGGVGVIVTIMVFVILIFLSLAVINGKLAELISLNKVEIEMKKAEIDLFSGRKVDDE